MTFPTQFGNSFGSKGQSYASKPTEKLSVYDVGQTTGPDVRVEYQNLDICLST